MSDATNVDDGVYVHFNPADGTVNAGTGTKILNAVFRSKAVSLPDVNEVVWGDGTLTLGAIVELHYPFADPAATVAGALGGTTVGPTEDTQRYFDRMEEREAQREAARQQRNEMRTGDVVSPPREPVRDARAEQPARPPQEPRPAAPKKAE